MIRNLSGVFIKTENKEPTCFEELTKEEQLILLDQWDKNQVTQLTIILANIIKEIGEQLDVKIKQDDTIN
jgi:hypothetical protein